MVELEDKELESAINYYQNLIPIATKLKGSSETAFAQALETDPTSAATALKEAILCPAEKHEM